MFPPEQVRKAARDFLVLHGQQHRPPLHDDHIRAERAEKCASSTPTNPPPMMISRFGCVGNRSASSEEMYGVSSTPGIGGTTGRLPARS